MCSVQDSYLQILKCISDIELNVFYHMYNLSSLACSYFVTQESEEEEEEAMTTPASSEEDSD